MTRLFIDIGNTNTSMAVTKGKRIVKRYFISSAKKRIEPGSLKRLLGMKCREIETVVIVSVVPKFCVIMQKSLGKILPHAKIRIVGKQIKVPMRIRYKDPRQVGQDRLVTAFSAYKKMNSAVLVIDFGTAVTFDFVNTDGAYEGGLIFPGLRLALNALTKNAALLPKTELKYTKGLIGRDTRESINKGTLLGYASVCDGVIRKFRNKFGEDLKIAVTGGDAPLVAKNSRYIKKKNISPDLIFEGLCLLTA